MTKATSREDRQALVDLVREEVEAHKAGELERLSKNNELVDLSGMSKTSVKNCLKILSQESRDYRQRQIRSHTSKQFHSDPIVKQGYRERMINSNKDPASRERNRKRMVEQNKDSNFISKRDEGLKRYQNSPEFIENARKQGLINSESPEFVEAARERGRVAMEKLNQDPEFAKANSERMKRQHRDPEYAKANRERAIKNIDNLRKNSYHVDGRFYTQSKQEGAVALLLEEYITDYKVKEGETFQVKDKGIGNGGLDFLVNGEFLEWHPIILSSGEKGKRGEIPTESETAIYRTMRNVLSEEDKKKLDAQYKKALGKSYQRKRQEAVDNSEYNGANVAHVDNVQELYDFMGKYSDSLPNYADFKREFNANVKTVKDFKVKMKAETLGEAV